ncbi:MAG: TonB family protein [Caulobacteraceae bacterium]|nr:TonB family protein [Caulobacteraceae bacterium]
MACEQLTSGLARRKSRSLMETGHASPPGRPMTALILCLCRLIWLTLVMARLTVASLGCKLPREAGTRALGYRVMAAASWGWPRVRACSVTALGFALTAPGVMLSAAMPASAAPSPPSSANAPANIPAGTGVAGLYCRRAVSGTLSDCRVSEEAPVGIGVGEAAIRSAEGSNVAGTAKSDPVIHISVRVSLTPEQISRTPAPGPPLIMTPAQWLNKPSAARINSAYPARAMEAGAGGSVLLSCRVTKTGALYSCLVGSEAPAGLTFGAAALKLTDAITLPVQTRDGEPIEWTVSLPMKFVPSQTEYGFPEVK